MGETVFRRTLNVIFGSIVMWAMIGPPPQPIGFLFIIPAVLGAWILNFCISVIIGLAAFVTEDVNAFVWIYQKMAFIFGGLIIPLDFYPAWMQTIARLLPFSAMLYLPAHLFVSPSLAALFYTLTI